MNSSTKNPLDRFSHRWLFRGSTGITPHGWLLRLALAVGGLLIFLIFIQIAAQDFSMRTCQFSACSEPGLLCGRFSSDRTASYPLGHALKAKKSSPAVCRNLNRSPEQ